jgi:hypothetical protein
LADWVAALLDATGETQQRDERVSDAQTAIRLLWVASVGGSYHAGVKIA